jgi:hypothetical protein
MIGVQPGGVLPAFTVTFHDRLPPPVSRPMQHPFAQQIELRSPEHAALQHLEPVHLPFDLPL